MSPEEFVKLVKLVVRDSAARGVKSLITEPPGRKPAEKLVTMSNWYAGLVDADRAKVDEVAEMGADLATYNFLLILDGLLRIDEGESPGCLRLSYDRNGERYHLNTAFDENQGEFLSSIFKSLDSPL